MTSVSIIPEESSDGKRRFRAIAGDNQSVGDIAGEALDAISAQLPNDSGTLIVVQRHHPGQFFGAAQHARLSVLMQKWRAARDSGESLSKQEESELQSLVNAELRASGDRAEFIYHDLKKVNPDTILR